MLANITSYSQKMLNYKLLYRAAATSSFKPMPPCWPA
jgi:hypothetical protein